MSMNVYLNPEKLENHKEFKRTEKRGNDGNLYDSFSFLGSHIFREKGKYYIFSHEIEEDLSQSVEELVDEISFWGQIPFVPKRAIGRYEHEDAIATVGPDRRDHRDCYEIKIRGKNMKNVRELYHLIRTGKILPKQSWEQEQMEREAKVKIPAESDSNLRDTLKPIGFSELFKWLIASVKKFFKMK